MTPSHHRLTNFQPIQPQGIFTVDKKYFEAIGKEDMLVQVPNGDKSKKIHVKDVLYAPNLSVTLLLVARITQAGYMLHFKQQGCQILDPKNCQIGTIPIINRLYGIRVKTPLQANTAIEDPLTVTPDELHRLMGYISTDAATKLVKDHLVDGIELDESQDTPKDSLCIKRVKLLNHSRPLMHDGKRTMESKSNSCTLIMVENIKTKNLTNTLQNEESNITT